MREIMGVNLPKQIPHEQRSSATVQHPFELPPDPSEREHYQMQLSASDNERAQLETTRSREESTGRMKLPSDGGQVSAAGVTVSQPGAVDRPTRGKLTAVSRRTRAHVANEHPPLAESNRHITLRQPVKQRRWVARAENSQVDQSMQLSTTHGSGHGPVRRTDAG